MDDTRELVDAGQVGVALAILSAVAALAGAGLALILRGQPPENTSNRRKAALLCGGAALVYPLWVVYNRIEDQFGLDSVLALGINGALFVTVGVVVGLGMRRWWPPVAPPVNDSPAPPAMVEPEPVPRAGAPQHRPGRGGKRR